MKRQAKRELAILLLSVGLGVAWGWDHVRIAGMLRRSDESERYFRQRLSECLGEKPDEQATAVGPMDLKNP